MKKITVTKKRFLLVLFFFSFTAIGFSQSQTFSTAGTNTFNVPAGVTTISVEAWGAGGRGGTRTNNGTGGGGGGGAYSRKVINVTPLTTINLSVGTGSSSTSAGGDSWVISSGTFLAKGGNSSGNNSSTRGTGGNAANCVGDIAFDGGDGINGSGSRGGGGGSSAGNASIGNDGGADNTEDGGIASLGQGGGNGGNGRTGSSGDGSNGSQPGGGGGGAYRTSGATRNGGNGGNGMVIISWGPEINVTGNTFSIADGDTIPSTADWTDFGYTNLVTPLTRTFTIQNTGFSTLNITGITFSGGNASEFSTTVPGNIAPGASATFTVTFTPTTLGTRTTTLNIANNDSNENPYNFAISAVAGTPEINIQGNNTNIPDNDTTPIAGDWTSFGSANIVGNTSIVRTFTIQNLGTYTLNIGTTSVITGSGDFSISSLPAASVPPGGSTTFTVTFDPVVIGTKTAVINVVNDDSGENPYNFSVTATATDPEINLTGSGNTIANGDNSPVTTDGTSFGTTNIGATIAKTFTIHNASGVTSALSVGAITFSGANPGDFSVTTAPGASVNAGSSTNFAITFSPTAQGTRTAVVSIANNDNDESPYTFTITGNGTDSEINVIGGGLDIADGDTTPSTADSTDFGIIDISSGFVTKTFTIENKSTATRDLSITGVTFTGTNAGDFSMTSGPAASLVPGASTTFVVRFNPTTVGTKNAVMNIANNDSNENPYNISITGLASDPNIQLSGNGVDFNDGDTSPTLADHTDFGSMLVSTGTVVRTFMVSNSGAAILNIGAITITGTNASDFTATSVLASAVPNGGSTTFTVTFNPSASGVRNATVNIVNNDSNEDPYNFSITGYGNDPEMNVVGNLVSIGNGDTTPSVSDNTDLGSVSIDAGSTLVTYTIQNSGVGTLALGAVTFSGADASNFAVTIPPAATIAAGGSTTFQISFNPTTIGIKNAIISIANDDSNESPYTFYITGLGVRTYPDTDGDGVSDNIDIDDDNDGIIDTMEQTNCYAFPLAGSIQHTFLNETFGAGTTKGLININIPGATCGYCYEDGIVGPNYGTCTSQTSAVLDDGEYVVTHKIAGSSSSDPENIHFDGAWNGPEDHTVGDTYGRMAVFNASYDPGIFYETTVGGIIPNIPITYEFWAMNILSQGVGGIKPNITVQFLDTSNNLIDTFNTGDIGRCLASTTSDACALSEWHQYTTNVNLGNNTSFIIRFINNANGGGGNDLALDDITIKQQYCDRDGDGIANIFDLDSDNDGIPDIEEGGFKNLSAGRAVMNLAGGVWVDANGNGLHDTIDAMIAGGTYALPDSDGDGANDLVDLDSDNDSLFDVDEYGSNNGDGDVDGDGVGEAGDSDNDGILNVFDTYVGFGTQVRNFAANTGGTGNVDYLDVDSNSDGIMDIAGTLYSALDGNNNGQIDGTADVDKDGIRDAFDTTTLALGSPRDLTRKLFVDLDGRNDYADGENLIGAIPNATIMGWIKLTSPFSTTGFVMGQDNFNLKIDAGSGSKVTATAKGVTITYNTNLTANRWYHIAAVYDGNGSDKLKLYVNGRQEVASQNPTLAGTLPASALKFTMGRNPVTLLQYFKGALEEVRVFNASLSTDQIQKMVYQEIQQNGTAIRGAVIPKDVELSAWSSLLAYYRMDTYKDDVIDGYTTPTIDQGPASTLARIYNVKNIRPQLAPMPFVTTQSSAIDTAVSQGNNVFGMDVINYEWSIVNIKHNINLNTNMTNLGTFIDPSVNLVLNNDNQLRNTWYLRLNGRIDLQGKSQLVQTAGSDLDATSAGFIERDQQGTVNKFNYNYWGSPVGAINSSTNNNNFTVASVMKDATNAASPQNILWTTGLNSSSTSPITLSGYWIFKFQNVNDSYANWASVGPNGTLLPGQGFTLKGSNAASASQNYTFIGKPNNGTITSPIAANNLNLSGNPYASAIDANQFLTDNVGSLNGTIYFWEHFATNTTHNLADYQGGYAVRTIVGGTPPVSPTGVSGLGSSARTPGRYIPVGQGFFVTGGLSGGTITFNNGQRAFVKENNVDSNIMFRHASDESMIIPDNSEDIVVEDTYAKIRLGFNSSNNYHRQVLLGFMDDKATPALDNGYDARHIDVQPNDMYFMNAGEKLNIQGDDYFNVNDIFPIGIKTAAEGSVNFILDGLENFDESTNIYIYDNVTGIYHDIREEAFAIDVPAGIVNDRFSMRFTNGSLGTGELTLENGIAIAYANTASILHIKNNLTDATAETVALYNMLGQSIATWDVGQQDQRNIEIPVKGLSTGTYIVKIKTTKGDISKKIVVR